MIFNYEEICEDFLKDLPKRIRTIIVRRFGLKGNQRETLQTIGEDFGITRERVRQIQNFAISRLRSKIKRHQPVFQFFAYQLRTTGNLRKEDTFLRILGPELFANEIYFLLSVGEGFDRFFETREFYTCWTIDRNSLTVAKKTTEKVSKVLRKNKKPLETSDLESLFNRIQLPALLAYLEASKFIQRGPQGLWGLRDWPEINPKGVRDKAYIIFKREKRPLHFKEVAQLINESGIFPSSKKAHYQTVHNELIKDDRFVLVGRGLYALAEWGYKPGVVKDIIVDVLRNAKKPLTKEEIVEEVLKQRVVAKNTILLNLHDKRYFKKNSEGKYELLE